MNNLRDGILRHRRDRILRLRDGLTQGLVERDVAVRLALLAALAGEHLLLVGPPGTAKSLIARRLSWAFEDAVCFERLLTRFSVPEELFGPLSIKGLEEDRYERLTESYLPTAHIAFLDEIFKANSAILNALLTLLNEREFDNGSRREKTPLVAVVGASNELPEGEELDALFDRFLLRLHVGPVSKDAFPELLGLKDAAASDMRDLRGLSREELAAVRKNAEGVQVPDDVTTLLCDLRDWCSVEKMPVSDRRWRKIVKLLRVSAWTDGRDAVSVWDCWLLQHCLWGKVEDKEKIYDRYVSRIGVASSEPPSQLIKIVGAWEHNLDRDRKQQTQKCDSEGEPLYVREDGKHIRKKNREYLFKLPDGCIGYGDSNREELLHPTNHGEGYTKEELEEYLPINRKRDRYHGGGMYLMMDEDFLDDFVNDEENVFTADLKPAMEPLKHKPSYIRHCLTELGQYRSDVNSHKAEITERLESLDGEIRDHLWVTDDFGKPASLGLEEAISETEKLLVRLDEASEGYESLPQEEETDSAFSSTHGEGPR